MKACGSLSQVWEWVAPEKYANLRQIGQGPQKSLVLSIGKDCLDNEDP